MGFRKAFRVLTCNYAHRLLILFLAQIGYIGIGTTTPYSCTVGQWHW